MSYTLQAIIGMAIEMAAKQPEGVTTVQLAADMAIWPIGAEFQGMFGVPALPLTDEGRSGVPSMIVTIAQSLQKCAYVEAEFFGGAGMQASVCYENSRNVGGIVVAKDAINRALRWLGVQAARGHDEFETVGLGAERHTDDWITP